jgi:hypothetical protein
METHPDHEERLAALIDRRLRQLPLPKSPPGLAPRVLAAIAARQNRPWWQTSWPHWPRHFQILILLLTAAVITLAAWHGAAFDPLALAGRARDLASGRLGLLRPLATLAADLAGALAHSVASAGQTFWTFAAAILAALYLACVGLGSWCYRLAFSNPNQSSL